MACVSGNEITVAYCVSSRSVEIAVIDILAHRIAVMQSSLLVEEGERDAILNHAKDPYSQRSIAAVPVPDPAKQKKRREARLAS